MEYFIGVIIGFVAGIVLVLSNEGVVTVCGNKGKVQVVGWKDEVYKLVKLEEE